MCEHCEKSKLVLVDRVELEEDMPCESGSEDGPCSNGAEFEAKEYYCENHLCEQHRDEINKSLDEGLGDFMRECGFEQAVDFHPIQTTYETCNYIDPTSLMRVICPRQNCMRI